MSPFWKLSCLSIAVLDLQRHLSVQYHSKTRRETLPVAAYVRVDWTITLDVLYHGLEYLCVKMAQIRGLSLRLGDR